MALKSLIYFSLFEYPLTEEEVFNYSGTKDKLQVHNDLEQLIKLDIIEKVDGFLLFDKNKKHILKRLNGNKNAKAIMPKAFKTAQFISKFPFIKGVAVSGSLSKCYFDADSDFDFFVITKPKRVWITRAIFALYKRLFLSNSYQEFCLNYFVSTETLEIEEKNRFTATEIVTVIPIYGQHVFKDFYKKNKWVQSIFPNILSEKIVQNIKEITPLKSVKLFEFLCNNFIGDLLNYICMKIISKSWAYRYRAKNNNSYKSKKEIAKHHPVNFQDKVIQALNKKYKSCQELHGIHIPAEHV
jgi:hypothetical protein